MLCHYLNPDVVYVDGAYMMRPSEKGIRGWESVVNVARGLKQKVAAGLMVPVFATYQFNKNAMKDAKKKKAEIGLEHVAGSQEIAWLSSVLLALTLGKSGETADAKLIEVLKGRDGETGSFWTRFNFGIAPYMDFGEIEMKAENLTFN